MTASQIGWAVAASNGVTFFFSFVWGGLTDKIGRRWAMIIPATIGFFVTPIYLLSTDYTTILLAFTIQGAFAGCIDGINPSYANERFPTDVRATGAGFCVHVGAVAGGTIPPILTWAAVHFHTNLAMPMMVSTMLGIVSFVVTLMFSPETRGKELQTELKLA
jgi:MFS transporter, SHS family, lactate transporter